MFEDFDGAVADLMDEFGTVATYEKTVGSGYTPGVGITGPTPTKITVQAILMDLTLSSNGLSMKAGTEILAGDKQLFVRPLKTPLTIDPTTDYVTVAGIKYRIVTFKEVNPTGSQAIVYSLYIRR